jgi:type II secretory pathway component PulF
MRRLSYLIHRIWPRRVRVGSSRAGAAIPSEALFAAAFGELLLCGLPAATALVQAAEIVPSRRFRKAAFEMVRHFRSGYCLEVSLRKTEYAADPGLLAALATGEEVGPLGDEMLAYAKSHVGGNERVLHRAFGRTAAAAAFAAGLSRLMTERPLTLDIIVAAGRLVVGRYPEFTPLILREIHDEILGGAVLAEAVRRHPSLFDPLFIHCVAACETRPALRAALERLGR